MSYSMILQKKKGTKNEETFYLDRAAGGYRHHRNTFTLKKLIFSAVFCYLIIYNLIQEKA